MPRNTTVLQGIWCFLARRGGEDVLNNSPYRVHSGCVKAVEEVDHVGSNREEY